MPYHTILAVLPYTLLFLVSSSLAAEEKGCNIPLDPTNPKTDPCIAKCLGQKYQDSHTFTCDISADWLHHLGGGGRGGNPNKKSKNDNPWYPATPPKGTGVHEYVTYTYREDGTIDGSKPPCAQNGHCPNCNAVRLTDYYGQYLTPLCSVTIDPETCTITSCADLFSPKASPSSLNSTSSLGLNGPSLVMVVLAVVVGVGGWKYHQQCKMKRQKGRMGMK